MGSNLCLAVLLAVALQMGQPVAADATADPAAADVAVILEGVREIGALARTDPRAASEKEALLLGALEKRDPDRVDLPFLLNRHLLRTEVLDLQAARTTAARFAGARNAAVRAAAQGWQRIDRMRTEPLELSFTAIDGRRVDLAELRGKVVVLEFTGVTWCPACRVAEAKLKRLYRQYRRRGLEIIAITYEFSSNDRDKAAALIRERELPWPFSFDGLAHESSLIAPFGVKAYPTAFVLGRDGRLLAHAPKGDALERAIVEALRWVTSTSINECRQT